MLLLSGNLLHGAWPVQLTRAVRGPASRDPIREGLRSITAHILPDTCPIWQVENGLCTVCLWFVNRPIANSASESLNMIVLALHADLYKLSGQLASASAAAEWPVCVCIRQASAGGAGPCRACRAGTVVWSFDFSSQA